MSGYLSNDHGISGNVVGRAMHTPSLTVGSEAISHETELYARRMQLNGFINAPLESPQHQLTEFNKESHSPIPGVVNPLYASRRSQPSMHWQLPNHQNSLNDEASHSDDSDRTSDYAEPDFASIKHIPLLAQLGIPSQHHLSMLTVHKATALLDTTYAYLRIQPSDSDEYPETLRLVQDLSHHLCVTPSAFEVKGVTFDRKDVVGHGGEAIIYRGQMDGHEVVVREVPMSPTERKRSRGRKIIRLMNREAITHSQLCHSNILQFLGVYHDTPDSPPIVILPFCDGGSLHDLLNNGLIMEVNKFTWIVIGITRGVTYLHSQNPPIIHGDLHPGNVLLDQHGNAYLSDFGFSRIRHEVTRTHTSIKEGGNLRFLAPELSSGTSKDFRTSKESDIFGLAMTFFNAWTGKKPFLTMF
ncbi:kinase-like protein [Clavulina sp. PMI_390]|nr:kinase-like protein [Clavulina sp. PMI_390]